MHVDVEFASAATEICFRHSPNLHQRFGFLDTPMHLAARTNVTILVRLISMGGNVNVKGMDEQTPMHSALLAAKIDCVKLLLEHGASVNNSIVPCTCFTQLANE